MEKSAGQLRFEREVSALEQRIQRGEITDSLSPGAEFSRILEETLPQMTASERDAIQRTQLRAHAMGAEILSELGQPVPGNDPVKPN
jgi:hypothetical protein